MPKRQRSRRLKRIGATAAAVALAGCCVVCGVVQPTSRPQVEGEGQASAQRLRSDVTTIVEGFGPRGHLQPEALDRVADHIAHELELAGAGVQRQVYEGLDGLQYQNVIARFGPTTGPVVIVGAHYDAADGLPGADDNASGTAGLLELARLLGRSEWDTAIELVAYSTEEPPHFRTQWMGSAVHADAIAASQREVVAMLSLEMIGRFSDEPRSQTFPAPGMGLLYPTKGNFIALVGKTGQGGVIRRAKRAFRHATDLPVRSITAPTSVPGIDFSDHLNYWAYDMDALMVTDTAFFRNFDYHTQQDTVDRLDFDRMAKVVDGVYGIVAALATGT